MRATVSGKPKLSTALFIKADTSSRCAITRGAFDHSVVRHDVDRTGTQGRRYGQQRLEHSMRDNSRVLATGEPHNPGVRLGGREVLVLDVLNDVRPAFSDGAGCFF